MFIGRSWPGAWSGRRPPMGEKDRESFQFTFNGFLKVEFHGSRVTSDAGLVLVRELDERLGLTSLITEHLTDSRHGLKTQFGLADLVRQSVCSPGWLDTKTSTMRHGSRSIRRFG